MKVKGRREGRLQGHGQARRPRLLLLRRKLTYELAAASAPVHHERRKQSKTVFRPSTCQLLDKRGLQF